jgi:hypothetical protein
MTGILGEGLNSFPGIIIVDLYSQFDGRIYQTDQGTVLLP